MSELDAVGVMERVRLGARREVPDDQRLREAIRRSAELGMDEVVPQLTSMLSAHFDDWTRSEAAEALGRLRASSAVEALAAVLLGGRSGPPDPGLRDAPHGAYAAAVVAHEAARVRHAAAVALGQIGDEPARQALVQCSAGTLESSAEVRRAARRGLYATCTACTAWSDTRPDHARVRPWTPGHTEQIVCCEACPTLYLLRQNDRDMPALQRLPVDGQHLIWEAFTAGEAPKPHHLVLVHRALKGSWPEVRLAAALVTRAWGLSGMDLTIVVPTSLEVLGAEATDGAVAASCLDGLMAWIAHGDEARAQQLQTRAEQLPVGAPGRSLLLQACVDRLS